MHFAIILYLSDHAQIESWPQHFVALGRLVHLDPRAGPRTTLDIVPADVGPGLKISHRAHVRNRSQSQNRHRHRNTKSTCNRRN
jgi:hypothetical protein